MTPEQFCYWLEGHFELSENEGQLTPEQVQVIQDHLQLVFEKQTPVRKPSIPANRSFHQGNNTRYC